MIIDTYYKDGKEYAKQYGTEVEVSADQKTAVIDGIVYTLRHAKAPKPAAEPAEEIKEESVELEKPAKTNKRKTSKRKK